MENASKAAMAARLKTARELRFEHATEAAEALGLRVQTYLPYESGRTGFTHRIARLAAFFGVNEKWLLTGVGPMKRGDQHPVVELFDMIPADKQAYVLEMLELYAHRKRPE